MTDLSRGADGRPAAVLSRRRAQQKCAEEYLANLRPGDVIPAVAAHFEPFAAFCDVGAGVNALLPIDSISVSRIPHPGARFVPGQAIRAVVRSRDELGRLTLTHRELLGTWEENAARFAVGETVPGIIRSVEHYGVFVELTPNLAGLAEYDDTLAPGEECAVFIKSMIPQRMKIKLIVVDSSPAPAAPPKWEYVFTGTHMDRFRYSPAGCEKTVETVF